jgi:glycosyltransferase involved in cell wall biosynthesis
MRRVFEEAGMPVEVVDVSAALTAASPAEFQLALAQAVTTDWNQVDLVLANTMVSFWAIHAARQAGKPSLFYVHESAPVSRFFGPLLQPALIPLVEAAFRNATRVVFTASSSRAVFAAPGRGRNYRVLPSWLDVAAIDAFAAAHTKAELRLQYGIDPAAVVILNLGTVCERKGQHTFIRAAELLEPELRQPRHDGPVEFVMVGARADDFLALLQLQVSDAKLQCVRFVPETRENFAWLRLADILVCTSFEESSPRVLLEAAAFGLPIVSTDVNGIPELVTDAEAWLVKPGDPSQLAAALRQALAARAAADDTRARRARYRVTQRFDERVALPRHLALANEAVANYP